MSTDAETLEAELRSYGISVEQVAIDDGIELEYMTAFPGDRIHDGEIGRACNTLIDMAEADEWEPTDVDATVVRAPGDVLGTWRAEAEWFEELVNYEITETEFSTRVLKTMSHESATTADGDADDDDVDDEKADAVDDNADDNTGDVDDNADDTDDAYDDRTDGKPIDGTQGS